MVGRGGVYAGIPFPCTWTTRDPGRRWHPSSDCSVVAGTLMAYAWGLSNFVIQLGLQ